ncbi:ADP-ribosyltransferase exoenzyme [uncultured virus]|nr:ADP-ribosyltransferase exoenzyme [uncultured virus]
MQLSFLNLITGTIDVIDSTNQSQLDQLIIDLYNNKAAYVPNEDDSNIKAVVSSFTTRVPMYNASNAKVYLIHKKNVFTRIVENDYRFVTPSLVNTDPVNSKSANNQRIMSNYDLSILNRTYTNVFYYSFLHKSLITDCKRPSYQSGIKTIKPYYNLNELYYLAQEWNITDKATLANETLLCDTISQYDISADILISHQRYIYKFKYIGLVKHYSLFGSYYMNNYIRSSGGIGYRNTRLESSINIMRTCISKAPAFDKSHYVYRFINTDSFINMVQVGEQYIDKSFMSTTRNPLYYKESTNLDQFGYILLKIKLPKNRLGVALCIESYSNFPYEEEIVINANSIFTVDNITTYDSTEQHTKYVDLIIHKKYELTWVGISPLSIMPQFSDTQANDPIITLDMPALLQTQTPIKLSRRLLHLLDNINSASPNNQFTTSVGSKSYVFDIGSFDSSTVYGRFFYEQVTDGIMLTTSNPVYGNINLFIEIGNDIHVNYYFKFSLTDSTQVINVNTDNWIMWLSRLSFICGTRYIYIHPNYALSSNHRTTYCQDIYEYLKHGTRVYDHMSITPTFDYSYLNVLEAYTIAEVIPDDSKTNLIHIIQDHNIPTSTSIKDLYIMVIELYPDELDNITETIKALLPTRERNPFYELSYKLDGWAYLIENNQIDPVMPLAHKFKRGTVANSGLVKKKRIIKFENRLRSYLEKTIAP